LLLSTIIQISSGEKLSIPDFQLLSLKFILNLNNERIKGKNVISYCLNNATNKVIATTIKEGIAAISAQVFGSSDLNIQ
jgi:hypothetical protein